MKFFKVFIGAFAIIGALAVLTFLTILTALLPYGKDMEKAPSLHKDTALVIDFRDSLQERSVRSPFDSLLQKTPPSLHQIKESIYLASKDPKITKLVGIFGSGRFSLADIEELAPALDAYQFSGKTMVAYGADFGGYAGGSSSYALASYFDNIQMQPMGMITFTGPATQSPYFAKLLKKVGIAPEIERRAEYKTYANPVLETSMPASEEEMLRSLFVNLNEHLQQIVMKNRGITSNTLKEITKNSPIIDTKALEFNLIDGLSYYEDLVDTYQLQNKRNLMNVRNYLAYKNQRTPKLSRDIAVLIADGQIMPSQANKASPLGDDALTPSAIRQSVKEIIKQKERYKGVIIRINSPGGSAQASEAIRYALTEFKKNDLPSVVSMGATAASGGYWIATGSDYIVAQPSTLTGSIGVISGKFSAEELMKKLDINISEVSLSESATMWSPLKSFTPEQALKHKALVDYTYQAFLERVANARGFTHEEAEKRARGRVYTGEQALELNLVDALGGLDTAARYLLEIPKTENMGTLAQHYDYYPQEADQFDQILQLLSQQVAITPKMIKILTFAKPFVAEFMLSTHTTPGTQAHMPYHIQE